jgi:hypothetical protein
MAEVTFLGGAGLSPGAASSELLLAIGFTGCLALMLADG